MIGNSKDVAAVSRHLARLLDVEEEEVVTKLHP